MSSEKKIIEIKRGYEYQILTDNPKNMFDKERFFYPVYDKTLNLLSELCPVLAKEIHSVNDDFSNNIIMYCAERGGGKSTALSSVGKWLNDLDNFDFNLIDNNNGLSKYGFYVLNTIDPAAITEKDFFMRVVLSRMFSSLRQKWDKQNFKNDTWCEEADYLSAPNTHHCIINKFMECYRLLDAVYQSGGNFDCDDDLEDLAELGDSGCLKTKFLELVHMYLSEISDNNHKSQNFLVVQIDDTDLNSKMAFNIIEDIRKFCVIPNIIILMAVNIKQMYQVIEQHFAYEFKILLDTSNKSEDQIKDIHLRDCYKMSMRYIDKIMPAAHQIHLPVIDDIILNSPSEVTVRYFTDDDKGNSKNILSFNKTPKRIRLGHERFRILQDEITDYQEILINLIYNKTGIPLIKSDNYLHRILPRTMRGLSHFLAYMCQLPDLDQSHSIAEANVVCNVRYRGDSPYPRINWKKEDALRWLQSRLDNLDAFEQYFLKNWCSVRLPQTYGHVIEEISRASNEQKISAAIKWVDKLFDKNSEYDNKSLIDLSIDDKDENRKLSQKSYAYLQEKLRKLSEQVYNAEKSDVIYMFIYAIRFYFTLFFYRLLLSNVKRGKKDTRNVFYEVLKYTDFEIWEPHLKGSGFYQLGKELIRFKVDNNVLYDIFAEIRRNYPVLERNCIINLDNNRELNEDNYQDFIAHSDEIDSPSIYCDFATTLLYYACSDNSSIRTQDHLFNLLLNWDVQSYAEKSVNLHSLYYSSDQNINNPEPTYISTLRMRLLSQFEDSLNLIDYLPITWRFESTNNFAEQNNISLTNIGIVKSTVKFYINYLKSVAEKIKFPSAIFNDSDIDSICGMLNTTKEFISSINSNSKKIDLLTHMSKKLSELQFKCEILFKTQYEFAEALEKITTHNHSTDDIEKTKVYLTKISEPYNEWKAIIQNDKILMEIEEEINTFFHKINI